MRALVLTGPPACGKNTVAAALARRSEHCALIDVDTIRHMVVQPHVAPWGGEEGRNQQLLGVRNACLLARNLMDAGFDVIVCDVLTDETAAIYRAELSGVSSTIVSLLPGFETCLERAATRPVHLTPDEFETLYGQQKDFTGFDEQLDNSQLDPDRAADALSRHLITDQEAAEEPPSS